MDDERTHPWTDADLHAWQVLRPLLDRGGYLPWTEGALAPTALVRVCNEIALAGRRTIVELGSGISTVVIARLLRERGGRIDSLEHDRRWAALVRTHLQRERLEDLASVIETSLRPHPLGRGGAPWYDEVALAGIPDRIDLLLVDGPPAYGEGMAESRYPALPLLAGRLSQGALVILDDAERPGERAILAAWEAELPFRFTRDPAGRIAIGRRVDP